MQAYVGEYVFRLLFLCQFFVVRYLRDVSGNQCRHLPDSGKRRIHAASFDVFTLVGGTGLSNAADSFRGGQSESVDFGQVQDQQPESDTFRENYARFVFSYDNSRASASLGLNYVDEEYDQAFQYSRQQSGMTLDVTREISNSWSMGVFGRIGQREYDNIYRQDDDTVIGARLTWRRLRTLEVELSIDRVDRESTDAIDDYQENRAYLRFRYIPSLGG